MERGAAGAAPRIVTLNGTFARHARCTTLARVAAPMTSMAVAAASIAPAEPMRPLARSVPIALAAAIALGACSSVAKSIDPRRSTNDAVSPPSTACVVDRPYFEFQVETPARFIADSLSRVSGWVPGRETRGDSLAVQFIVDTVGRPEAGTFKVLRAQREVMADSVRQALPTWRYVPARLRGCRVRQLVQTGVTRG